jgi:hypothetical protein
MPIDLDKAAKSENPNTSIDQQAGKFKDPVEALSDDERFGTKVWKKAPDPKPIKGAR